MKTKAEMTREKILNFATDFIINHNYTELTFDSLAKYSGISKGGLMYHFPSKEALFKGIAEKSFDELTEKFNELAAKDPINKGKWTRALIEAVQWDIKNKSRLNTGIYSYSMLNPAVAESISLKYQYTINKIHDDDIDPVKASIIRLALDGIGYGILLNISPLNPSLYEEVLTTLHNMTTEND